MTEPDVTANYHGGNRESAEAFERTPAEQRQRQRARVLDYIASRGRNGATSDEAEAALSLTHQACSARFTEAKRDGQIVPADLRRRTRSGRMARVYVIPDRPAPAVLPGPVPEGALF